MTHTEPHPLRGNTVEITGGLLQGQAMYVVDWWDHITGESWMGCVGSPECFDFALRSAVERAPIDNEAVYGLIGLAGKIIHATHLPQGCSERGKMLGYRLIVRGKDAGHFVNEAEAWGKAWLLDKNDHKEKGMPLGALICQTDVLLEVGQYG